MIVLNEEHLKRLIKEFVEEYYLGLGRIKDCIAVPTPARMRLAIAMAKLKLGAAVVIRSTTTKIPKPVSNMVLREIWVATAAMKGARSAYVIAYAVVICPAAPMFI